MSETAHPDTDSGCDHPQRCGFCRAALMTSKSTESVDVAELRRLAEKATPGPASVGYDGPSRPIICTRPSFEMLSISKLTAPGRHESYEREDEDCRLFAFILTHAREIVALLEEKSRMEKLLDFAWHNFKLLFKDQPWGAYINAIYEDADFKALCLRYPEKDPHHAE